MWIPNKFQQMLPDSYSQTDQVWSIVTLFDKWHCKKTCNNLKSSDRIIQVNVFHKCPLPPLLLLIMSTKIWIFLANRQILNNNNNNNNNTLLTAFRLFCFNYLFQSRLLITIFVFIQNFTYYRQTFSRRWNAPWTQTFFELFVMEAQLLGSRDVRHRSLFDSGAIRHTHNGYNFLCVEIILLNFGIFFYRKDIASVIDNSQRWRHIKLCPSIPVLSRRSSL